MNQTIISNNEFQRLIAKGEVTKDLELYLQHMNEVHKDQSYLTDDVFHIYQEYYKICESLLLLDFGLLNNAQQLVVKNYNAMRSQNIYQIQTNNNEESGTKLVLGSNGVVNTLLIIATTIAIGLNIAWIFISKLK